MRRPPPNRSQQRLPRGPQRPNECGPNAPTEAPYEPGELGTGCLKERGSKQRLAVPLDLLSGGYPLRPPSASRNGRCPLTALGEIASCAVACFPCISVKGKPAGCLPVSVSKKASADMVPIYEHLLSQVQPQPHRSRLRCACLSK